MIPAIIIIDIGPFARMFSVFERRRYAQMVV
jgi:hypothetical protein